jgi:hypothetical protein
MRHALDHQPGNEGHIARKAIELGHNGTSAGALWPALP